jgi:hypothetical protein
MLEYQKNMIYPSIKFVSTFGQLKFDNFLKWDKLLKLETFISLKP